jgi:hypothetical protein
MVKARGPLPVANASNYVHQAALGLQHAHEHGLVHRDIKPSNLMLARQWNRAVVKVLDFGLAKVSREVPADGTLTFEGQMLGTPDFIAPEQSDDARKADIRADIYSLGCTLYYLLTSGPPFQGTSLYDILQAHHSRDALPLNLARPDVPVDLATLVAKMMAKEPERRFQTPAEVSKALTPFFKPGANAGSKPSPEISRVGQAASSPQTLGGGSAPAQPATQATAPAPAPRAPSKANPEGVAWESLIAFRETEGSTAVARRKPEIAPTAAPVRRPPWVWAAVATGVLLFGLLAAWLGVFKVKTPDGVIVLKDVPQDAEIFVDGDKVTLAWPGSGKPFEIRTVPGDHKVEVKKDGFRAFGETVRVKMDKSPEVTVQLEPLVVNRPPQEKQTEVGAKGAEEPKIAAVPVPTSDLDRIATGKWVRLVDSKTVLSDPQEMKFQNGILELDHTRMLFPKINVRDVILRARVRRVSGHNVSIGLRCGAVGFLAAFFDGIDISEGDRFGIGRKLGGTYGDGDASTWKDLAVLHIGRKIQPDQFVEMAFAAIGDTLTLYVDGARVITVKNNEFAFASGYIGIAAKNARGLFKDVECQILDPVHISNPAMVDGVREGVLLSTGEMESPSQWLYTTIDPGAEWASPQFDTRQWTPGLPTFGHTDLPNIPIRTRWETPAIWLRTSVVVPGLSPSHILTLRLWNDDDVEIYVNGKLLIQRHYEGNDYGEIFLDSSQRALFHEGKNTLAVHCVNNPETAQIIDVGLRFLLKARDPSPASPATASWTPLFNGKDLTGWESLENGSSWKVENGVLEGRGGGLGRPAVLLSKRQDFENFRLRARVRYPVGDSYGWIELRRTSTDEGINGYFVSHGVWPTPNSWAPPFGSVQKASDFRYGTARHWQTHPIPTSFGTNTWYTIEVSLYKNILTTSVDGKELSDFNDVDESHKFGAIALACAGVTGPVQFQDIMIRELPADSDPGKR